MSRSQLTFFLFIPLLAITTTLLGWNWSTTKGEGPVVSDVREVKAFTKVHSRGAADVILRVGDRHEVVIEAQQNLLPLFKVEVQGDTLILSAKENMSSSEPIRITVTAPAYKAVGVDGSGNLTNQDLIKAESFSVSLAGSGDIDLTLEAQDVSISVAGSGDIALRGRTESQNISIAGSGDVDALFLHSQTAKISIAGSGDAQVHATETLAVNTVGSGDVGYRGHPKVNARSLGSGEVYRLKD